MKKLKIIIFVGVDDGICLWVGKEGDVGLWGGFVGDLYVFLMVEMDKYFVWEGMNICFNLEVSYF